uniref:Uncharacterized protein n=1 Tax=Anopheles minimus TaxID=112268 RepID=A0A182WJV8_9DIPT
MFSKVMIVALLAVVASVSAKPGALLPAAPFAYTAAAAAAPLAYSAPLAVAPAALPAVAYTAGYANVGDSAVVTSHNTQVINPAYAAYSAAPFVSAYAAAPALASPFAYSAPLAAKYVL